MGIASQGEAGAGVNSGPLQRSGPSEETIAQEGDDDDAAFELFAKNIRYQAVDANYQEKIKDDAIDYFWKKEEEFKKAGLSFFDCINTSSGKITLTSLTTALKASKKQTLKATSFSQMLDDEDEDDDDDGEDEKSEEENSGDEENPYGDYPPDGVDGLNKPFNIMNASQDAIDIEIGNLPNFNLNFNPNLTSTLP